MSVAQFTIPLIVQTAGNVIVADEAMDELTNIANNLNPTGVGGYQDSTAQKQLQEDPATGLAASLGKDLEQIRYQIAALTGKTYWYETPDISLASLFAGEGGGVPIGSIIPFYDFDGALTFDTDAWTYCDGSTDTVGGSSRTLPDLSGRYLVGFGTPNGGGDLDSATWATAAVGRTSHTSASIAHTHTGPSHTHTVAHNHLMVSGLAPSAYQSNGSSTIALQGVPDGINQVYGFESLGSYYTQNSTPTTSSSGTGNTGSALTTISVQPESIRVRFIMRKA